MLYFLIKIKKMIDILKIKLYNYVSNYKVSSYIPNYSMRFINLAILTKGRAKY